MPFSLNVYLGQLYPMHGCNGCPDCSISKPSWPEVMGLRSQWQNLSLYSITGIDKSLNPTISKKLFHWRKHWPITFTVTGCILLPISDTLWTDFLTSHKSLCTCRSPLCCYTIQLPSHCLNWNEVAPAVFGQWKLYEYPDSQLQQGSILCFPGSIWYFILWAVLVSALSMM